MLNSVTIKCNKIYNEDIHNSWLYCFTETRSRSQKLSMSKNYYWVYFKKTLRFKPHNIVLIYKLKPLNWKHGEFADSVLQQFEMNLKKL